MEELIDIITLNFIDEMLETFDEKEFILWLEVGGEVDEKTLKILEDRLIKLEYFEHLKTLQLWKK